MPDITLPLVRGDKITSDVDYTDFLPLNMIAVAKPILGAQGYMISHDGLTQIATASGVDRGGFYDDRRGYHVRVIGNTLYKLVGNTLQSIGAIDGSGQCSFAYSFNHTAILSDGNVYFYNGTTLLRLTDPDLKRPVDLDWIDSYFFYTDGEYIYHSLLADEKQVDALQFATAEIMPDKTLGVMRTQDNLMAVFGRYSIEYFINQANDQFAFSRITQKSVNGGICGTHCKTMVGDTIFVLGGRKNESPSIHVLQSSMLESVSTRSVDKILATYTEAELSQAVLESRTDKRDQFLIVRLLRHTLLLNVSAAKSIGITESWSQLSYGVDLEPWLGRNGVYDPMQNAWIYGSANGNAYRIDDKTAAQANQQTEFELRTTLVEAENIRISKVEVNTVSGFTDTTTAALSVTLEGAAYTMENWLLYSTAAAFDRHFIFRRIGYIPKDVSFRLRGVSKNKVNFCNFKVTYG